jgi:hypothetical protein
VITIYTSKFFAFDLSILPEVFDAPTENILSENIISRYPPLRIGIINSIDGVDFKDAIQNMNQVKVGKGFTINFIGLRDFVKNKQTVGGSQDMVDIREIQKIKPVKKVPGKKKGKHS